MPRTNVSSHTRRRNGRTENVRQHDRATRGAKPTMWTLSPGRGVRNAGKAFMAWKHRRKAVAVALAALAVGDIVGYTVFKVSGGLLLGASVALGLIGGGLLMRSRG